MFIYQKRFFKKEEERKQFVSWVLPLRSVTSYHDSIDLPLHIVYSLH